jgi:hypothetical protein
MATPTAKALYLELTRNYYTSQMLLIPQVLNVTKNKTQKSKLITRQMHATVLRRAWRYYSFSHVPLIEKTEDHQRALRDIEGLMGEFGPFLVGSVAGGWELVNQPLIVEMSAEDLDDVWEAKTPQALIRRVLKARTEAGYPAELCQTPAV